METEENPSFNKGASQSQDAQEEQAQELHNARLDENDEKFYSDAVQYWSNVPPTLDGMLGGFGFISQIDIQGSKQFLKRLYRDRDKCFSKMRALDCGCGIGRITKHLLAPQFGTVDMVEQNSKFLDQAEAHIGPRLFGKVGERYCKGLQEFQPEEKKYDLIWCQWVLGHLKDEHLVEFFIRCKQALKPNGFMVVKENIASTTTIDVDEKDSSVTRPLYLLRSIFNDAGFYCFRQLKQTNFPKGLYTVIMFALKPKSQFPSEATNENDSSVKKENIIANEENVTVKDAVNVTEDVQNQIGEIVCGNEEINSINGKVDIVEQENRSNIVEVISESCNANVIDVNDCSNVSCNE